MSIKKNETIEDIAKMMRRNEEVFHHLYWCEYADRIEAAAKREREATCEKSSLVGNAAKMREALSDACYAMFNFLKTQNGGYEEIAKALDKAKAALADLPRNCDVRTEEAQEGCFICSSRDCQSSCPLLTAVNYGLTLDQMPYEEGGAK